MIVLWVCDALILATGLALVAYALRGRSAAQTPSQPRPTRRRRPAAFPDRSIVVDGHTWASPGVTRVCQGNER
jgi:hypothetical protein